jgi:hypothetical protein
MVWFLLEARDWERDIIDSFRKMYFYRFPSNIPNKGIAA